MPSRREPDIQFHSHHAGKSYAKINLTIILTLTQTLLTLLNPTNRNHNSRTIKTHLFPRIKSTTPSKQRHVYEYTTSGTILAISGLRKANYDFPTWSEWNCMSRSEINYEKSSRLYISCIWSKVFCGWIFTKCGAELCSCAVIADGLGDPFLLGITIWTFRLSWGFAVKAGDTRATLTADNDPLVAGLSSVHTIRVHGPCSRLRPRPRPVNTGVILDTVFTGLWIRPVDRARGHG